MPLEPNRFTRKTGEAIGAAQSLAREQNHSQVAPEHLLAALVGQPEGVVLPVLERVGVAPKAVRDLVDAALAALPQVYGATAQTATLAPDTYRLLESADSERAELGDDYLSTEHILLAMAEVAGGVGDLLRGLGEVAAEPFQCLLLLFGVLTRDSMRAPHGLERVEHRFLGD